MIPIYFLTISASWISKTLPASWFSSSFWQPQCCPFKPACPCTQQRRPLLPTSRPVGICLWRQEATLQEYIIANIFQNWFISSNWSLCFNALCYFESNIFLCSSNSCPPPPPYSKNCNSTRPPSPLPHPRLKSNCISKVLRDALLVSYSITILFK